jgi:hypothetical protein
MGRRKLYYQGPKAPILLLPNGRTVATPHLLTGKAIDEAIASNPGLEKYFSTTAPTVQEEEE